MQSSCMEEIVLGYLRQLTEEVSDLGLDSKRLAHLSSLLNKPKRKTKV